MLLDVLKDFEWLNEPEEVYFGENGMKVKAMPDTDFWVNARHKFSKDNGHFFFKRGSGDFTVTAKWRFYRPEAFEQCGLMVRIDKNNWLKLSLMPENRETAGWQLSAQREGARTGRFMISICRKMKSGTKSGAVKENICSTAPMTESAFICCAAALCFMIWTKLKSAPISVRRSATILRPSWKTLKLLRITAIPPEKPGLRAKGN